MTTAGGRFSNYVNPSQITGKNLQAFIFRCENVISSLEIAELYRLIKQNPNLIS